MTDPHDPLRQELEEIEAKRQRIAKAKAKQDLRIHDPELSQHVGGLLERIRRLQAQTGGSQYDYETLRKEYDAKANAEVRELQKTARQERIQKLIAQADLNPDWIFDKMDATDPALQYPMETARYFISGFEHWEKSGGGCMLIYGDYGTGKSTLAGAVAHELIALHQKSVIFQQWASVVDRLFFNVIQDQEERNQYRRALEEVDLLIIDEVAANRTKMAESQSSFLGHLLRRRRNLSKSVIIITNHSPQSLHQAIGDFSFEAIKAFNPVDIHLSGPSRRPSIGHYNG
ncbi:DNA replication protein [Aeromonas encheleia]|jgi:DNA replication protein DnaC|uniref:DnaA ATPase domain-containing protein n=1 Tax=Aeromonas TaxID=642 RepID=UPI00051C9082|nr:MULTISPECIES: DnaA/Hda family protein [Aeromonas]MBV7439720.1 ATP-binding protein [Aeromonas sp. sif2416]MBV7600253.1 ATP-binding protein [Aeromonas sp. sia0103]MCH7373636.1 DnaA/Hda family protein [Aeromonas sp. MR16]VEG95298.1 DNA replication protein [Aeromonas encheleia]